MTSSLNTISRSPIKESFSQVPRSGYPKAVGGDYTRLMPQYRGKLQPLNESGYKKTYSRSPISPEPGPSKQQSSSPIGENGIMDSMFNNQANYQTKIKNMEKMQEIRSKAFEDNVFNSAKNKQDQLNFLIEKRIQEKNSLDEKQEAEKKIKAQMQKNELKYIIQEQIADKGFDPAKNNYFDPVKNSGSAPLKSSSPVKNNGFNPFKSPGFDSGKGSAFDPTKKYTFDAVKSTPFESNKVNSGDLGKNPEPPKNNPWNNLQMIEEMRKNSTKGPEIKEKNEIKNQEIEENAMKFFGIDAENEEKELPGTSTLKYEANEKLSPVKFAKTTIRSTTYDPITDSVNTYDVSRQNPRGLGSRKKNEIPDKVNMYSPPKNVDFFSSRSKGYEINNPLTGEVKTVQRVKVEDPEENGKFRFAIK
jgi:hypothetical protein